MNKLLILLENQPIARINSRIQVNFIYNKENLTTQDQLLVSVADLRDVIKAFTISNEVQRLQELQLILESIVRKNKLPSGALGVE